MFLRSKVQEMILRRRSRSMNGGCTQQSHLSNQHANSSTSPCDGGSSDGSGKGATARASFASPRLLHSSSLPAGSCATGSPMRDSETSTAYSVTMSPTSVLDASAAFASSSVVDAGGKRRPWCDGCARPHGLADALDCADDAQRKRSVLAAASRAVKAQAPALVRSCSLDRRVEFGVKNKSSWLPLRAGREEELAAAAPGEMEPLSEDYTCVISRGPNPRTVHIFGDRVVEAGGGVAAATDRKSSPRPINLPGEIKIILKNKRVRATSKGSQRILASVVL